MCGVAVGVMVISSWNSPGLNYSQGEFQLEKTNYLSVARLESGLWRVAVQLLRNFIFLYFINYVYRYYSLIYRL